MVSTQPRRSTITDTSGAVSLLTWDDLRCRENPQTVPMHDRGPLYGEMQSKRSVSTSAHLRRNLFRPRAKITMEMAIEIRDRSQRGFSGRELAQEYGVAVSTISHVVTKRTWTRLD